MRHILEFSCDVWLTNRDSYRKQIARQYTFTSNGMSIYVVGSEKWGPTGMLDPV